MSEAVCNRRILIIDDNPVIHEDFRKIFCSKLATTQALFDASSAPIVW